jgi:lipopolysaccharide export LptBFGC system permease protein LptF
MKKYTVQILIGAILSLVLIFYYCNSYSYKVLLSVLFYNAVFIVGVLARKHYKKLKISVVSLSVWLVFIIGLIFSACLYRN